MKPKFTVLLTLCIWLFSVKPVIAVTYYVSTGGSDGNSGRSSDSPWKTLAKIRSFSFQPGDQILFKAGGVWNEAYFTFTGSGTADKPIILSRYGSGNNPAVISPEYYAIKTDGQSYLIFDGIDVLGAQSNGYSIENSDHITIKNVYISSVGKLSGAIIIGGSNNILIENFHLAGNGSMGWGIGGDAPNNIIIKNGLIEDVGQEAEYQTHGMYISSWHDFLIEDVDIYRSWNSGIKIVGDVNNGKIQNVNIYDSGRSGGSGPGISLGDTRQSYIRNIVLENCLIANTRNPAVWNIDSGNNVQNITINHCTFVNNYYSMNIKTGSAGWKVTNNIGYKDALWDNNSSRVPLYFEGGSNISTNYFNYNNWYFKNGTGSYKPIRLGNSGLSLSEWQSQTGNPDSESISINPKFVNPGANNFRLQANSPACISGSNGTYLGAFSCDNSPSPASTVFTVNTGDANQDGKVDGGDYIIWLNHYDKTTDNKHQDGDFDGSGTVNGTDYIIWLNNYNK